MIYQTLWEIHTTRLDGLIEGVIALLGHVNMKNAS